MTNKYEDLKLQVINELQWALESVNMKHRKEGYIPYDVKLIDFLGNYNFLTEEERGMLFAYLSIKSKIDIMEET